MTALFNRQRYRGLVIVSCLILVATACAPTRSVEAFCGTIEREKERITERMERGFDSAEQSDDDLIAAIGGISTTLGAIGDLALYFEKLEEVAPNEIQPEMEVIAREYQEQLDRSSDVFSNPLGALAGGIMSGFQMAGPMDRANEFALENCGETL